MLTEQDRQDQAKQEIQEKLDFNNQIIVAAAKYEREIGHKDFLEILKDMQNVKEILDKELLVLTKQLIMTEDPTERAACQNEFITKAIRRMVIEEAISYPERIVHQAAMAKEENIDLKTQLKEKFNATGE
jgi:hypothetical protein